MKYRRKTHLPLSDREAIIIRDSDPRKFWDWHRMFECDKCKEKGVAELDRMFRSLKMLKNHIREIHSY